MTAPTLLKTTVFLGVKDCGRPWISTSFTTAFFSSLLEAAMKQPDGGAGAFSYRWIGPEPCGEKYLRFQRYFIAHPFLQLNLSAFVRRVLIMEMTNIILHHTLSHYTSKRTSQLSIKLLNHNIGPRSRIWELRFASVSKFWTLDTCHRSPAGRQNYTCQLQIVQLVLAKSTVSILPSFV